MRFTACRLLLVALSGLLAAVSTGCGHKPAPRPQPKVTLLVHAGAALRPALDELGVAFEKKTGLKVDFNYKGSACLLPDVSASHKGDVYIPGEMYFMQQAIDGKFVKPECCTVATMSTVLVVQAGNPKGIHRVEDLTKPGVRVGTGDPKVVAFGRAAKECCDRAGVWKKVEKNVTMSGQNVSEVGNAVKMKHVDAAIIWNATAALYNDKEIEVIPICKQQLVCSDVPVGVVAYTKYPQEAQQFVDFLASPEATAIFVKHGFGAPSKEAAPAAKTG